MNFTAKSANLAYFSKRNGVDLRSVFACADRMISVSEVHVMTNVVRILMFVFVRANM